MSIEDVIEKQIREAIERGEFDGLSGAGKPLDLDAYFNTPEDLRMAFSILRSNHFVPAEVETMNEIAALRERLAAAQDADESEKLAAEIQKAVPYL
jgi:hypothetical protein